MSVTTFLHSHDEMRSLLCFQHIVPLGPQMTFDLDMWLLTTSINDGSHVASMTQLLIKFIKAGGR